MGKTIVVIAALCLLGAATAIAQLAMPMIPYTQPAGPMLGLGGPMIPGNVGGSGPPPISGKLLLVDGVSFLLQTDGTSKICLAGGC
jgi:hypothetical protein